MAPLPVTLKVTFAVENLSNSHNSGNVASIPYMGLHVNWKRNWKFQWKAHVPCNFHCLSYAEWQARSLAVVFTVHILEMMQDRGDMVTTDDV